MAGASLPSDVLADEVKAAQKQWIRGSPEKVREFNAMLSTRKAASPELTLADQTAQNMGYENFAEAVQNPQMAETLKRALPPDVWEAAAGEASKPISWNDLQGFYEETGGKLYGGAGSLPGDIYKALQQVHDFIGNQMQQLANARGVGSQFREVRAFITTTCRHSTSRPAQAVPVPLSLRCLTPKIPHGPSITSRGRVASAALRCSRNTIQN